MARMVFRPLADWPYPINGKRKPPTFRNGWADTKELLLREVENLGGELVVVELDVHPGAVRRDGELRADVRPGDFPGVRVSFASRHGQLSYATDRYEWQYLSPPMKDWQANARAIALSLEALRSVDRHGVTRGGEQYTGWRELPAGSGVAVVAGADGASVIHAPDARMSRERAARVIADLAGVTDPAGLAAEFLTADGGDALRVHWRGIVRRIHPDRDGSSTLFAEATAAYAVLTGEST